MIKLEKVTEKTFKKILSLKVTKEQEAYVSSNLVSLAQAWLYYEHARPLAILLDEEPIGFMMLDWDEEERTVGIWRMMIDAQYQGKGCGKKALQILIEQIKQDNKFDLVNLSIVPENQAARNLYRSLGFKETGEIDDEEEIMVLPLTEGKEAIK